MYLGIGENLIGRLQQSDIQALGIDAGIAVCQSLAGKAGKLVTVQPCCPAKDDDGSQAVGAGRFEAGRASAFGDDIRRHIAGGPHIRRTEQRLGCQQPGIGIEVANRHDVRQGHDLRPEYGFFVRQGGQGQQARQQQPDFQQMSHHRLKPRS